MGLDLEYVPGQTSLDEEEIHGLLIPTITTRGDLDEFEQQNIEDALQWVMTRSFRTEQILNEAFVKEVHRKMYGNIWNWAGEFRKTEKNLGVECWKIGTELKCLLDDTLFWIQNETYPPQEIAVRFKHRLVSIHCFPNGNGRHSRLMADILIEKTFGSSVFTWGSADLVQQTNHRKNYLNAVKTADRGNIQPLLEFAKS